MSDSLRTARTLGELAGERGARRGENPYGSGTAEAYVWETARDYAVGDRQALPRWQRRQPGHAA